MSGETRIRAAVDDLGSSVVVLGCGPAGTAAVEAFGGLDGPGRSVAATAVVVGEPPDEEAPPATVTDAVAASLADATAAFVATDLGEPAAPRLLATASATADLVVALVALPPCLSVEEWDALVDLRGTADAVLVVPNAGGEAHADALLAALSDLVALVGTPGLVNLDLADLGTVLDAADLATAGRGTAPREAGATAAVAAAVDEHARLGVRHAPTVLVNVAGGTDMSVSLAGSAIEAVRDRVADDAHVVWGASVDDGLDGRLRVDLVVGGVHLLPRAGDACPRCGTRLVDYALDDSSTVACDDCGFANLATRLGDRG